MTPAYLIEAPYIYFSSADDGIIIDVNETLCTQLGYSREELIGKKLEQLFTIATRIFQQTHFFPLLKMRGYAEEIFITLLAKNGAHLPLLVSAKRDTINDQAVSVYAGITVHNRKKFEDELVAAKKAAEAALNENTALKQTREKLQQHTEQLERQINLVNKQNEELKQFSNVVTHNLQEPLRKLFIYSNLLQEKKDEASTQKSIEKINEAAQQMAATLSGLQQFVWLTETKVKPAEVDLHTLLLLVKDQVQAEHPEVFLHIVAETLPTIEADSEQMQVLFYQLLSNAVRFRKDNEVEVHISSSILLLNKFRNVADKYAYTEFVKIEIRDNGIGFDEVYTEKVFDLFRRFHSNSGKGVGLALCKTIVEGHHGNITMESQKEAGTTVRIFLPLKHEDTNVFDENEMANKA